MHIEPALESLINLPFTLAPKNKKKKCNKDIYAQYDSNF